MSTYSSTQVSAHFFSVGIMNFASSENASEKGINNSYQWEIAGGWALPMSTCASLQEVFKQAGAAQIEDKGLTVSNVTTLRFTGLKAAAQRKLE